MKQIFVLLATIVATLLLSSCNSIEHGKLHHVAIYVIKDNSGVTGFSVVKMDSMSRVIDSVYYFSPHQLDGDALAKAMEGVPKETPIKIYE